MPLLSFVYQVPQEEAGYNGRTASGGVIAGGVSVELKSQVTNDKFSPSLSHGSNHRHKTPNEAEDMHMEVPPSVGSRGNHRTTTSQLREVEADGVPKGIVCSGR